MPRPIRRAWLAAGDRLGGMKGAHASTCCRVDLAGGTLDIWPLGVMHPGAVTVNVALGVNVSASVQPRKGEGYRVVQGDTVVVADDLPGLAGREETRLVAAVGRALDLPPADIELASESPRGAGLGASSAVAIALMAAIDHGMGRPLADVDERAVLVRDLEAAMMQRPTGIQDQYPPLLGGVLALRYPPGGVAVSRLAVNLDALGASLHVAYSGHSHISGDTNWQVIRRRLDGDPVTREQMAGIVEVAAEMATSLTAGDLPAAGRLLDREWQHRRQLAEGVSTPEVEGLLDAARAAGAWGGKVCGAGGGGCVAVLAPPERRKAVANALRGAGGEPLDARPVASGVEVRLT